MLLSLSDNGKVILHLMHKLNRVRR